MRERTLEDYGYPHWHIVEVCPNGDPYRAECYPQEHWSAHTCGSCRKFNGEYCTKDWNNGEEDYCIPERDEKDPDNDTCGDIDYEERELEGEFRSPVRCEYDSDKDYEQACKAIAKINADIRAEDEHQYNLRMYGPRYWEED